LLFERSAMRLLNPINPKQLLYSNCHEVFRSKGLSSLSYPNFFSVTVEIRTVTHENT